MTAAAVTRQMKSAARLYAVQALFQMEAAGQSADSVALGIRNAPLRGVEYEGEELAEGDVDLFRACSTPP
jgi:N utilization substance protein B